MVSSLNPWIASLFFPNTWGSSLIGLSEVFFPISNTLFPNFFVSEVSSAMLEGVFIPLEFGRVFFKIII